jgi:hypothetical protein
MAKKELSPKDSKLSRRRRWGYRPPPLSRAVPGSWRTCLAAGYVQTRFALSLQAHFERRYFRKAAIPKTRKARMIIQTIPMAIIIPIGICIPQFIMLLSRH